ncbi:MAG: KH domain-containing protein [Actinomycetota bacterium]
MGARATLQFIASYLVEHPDDVQIEEEESGRTLIFELIVHPDDVGKVIGRNGRIARALRTVVKTAAGREDRNAMIEIVD